MCYEESHASYHLRTYKGKQGIYKAVHLSTPLLSVYGRTKTGIVMWVIPCQLPIHTVICSGDECYVANQILLDFQEMQNDIFFRSGSRRFRRRGNVMVKAVTGHFDPCFPALPVDYCPLLST